MRGVITGREIFQHGWTIVREFGPAAYGRCVVAVITGRPTTFLAVVSSRCRPAHAFLGAVVAAVVFGIAAGWAVRPETQLPLVDPSCMTACESEQPSA